MAKEAKITVHPSFEIGEISPRLFSTFLEPIGTMERCTTRSILQRMSRDSGKM